MIQLPVDAPTSQVSPGAQSVLVRLSQKGGDEGRAALEQLIACYTPLIAKYLPRARADAQDDAYQSACEAITRAVLRFDPERGTSLAAYLERVVKGAVVDAIAFDRGAPKDMQPPRSIYTSPGDEDADSCFVAEPLDPHDHYSAVDTRLDLTNVRTFVRGLPSRQRAVVAQVFYRDESQADAARRSGVSRAAVSQILAKVYERGRKELLMEVSREAC